jgi:cell division protein ZapB
MISEFELLANKVESLAELVHALRLENVELRRAAAMLTAENKDLQLRMAQAHERVAALLAQLPSDKDAEEDLA